MRKAFKDFWQKLSFSAQMGLIGILFAVFIIFALLTVYITFTTQSRTYYREKIENNDLRLDNICRNQPDLCK